MADNISEIISPEGERQLRELNEGLESAIQNITKFGQVAKGITVEFKGVKDFATLNELQNKVKETTDKMTKAQRDFADEIDRAQVREQAAVAKALAGYEKQAAATEKANAAREKAAQRAAAEAEKAAKREEKALKDLNSEYETLKRSYKTAADAAKELGVAAEMAAQKFGKQSAEAKTLSSQFASASASAKVMYDRLLKVEMAVGQGQRAVGQYSLAAEGLKQTLREMPAFANGLQTGLMAISNNLPTLIDGIKQLNQKNKDIVASGGEAVGVWDTMKEELKDFGTIAVIAVTALTLIVNQWDNIMSGIDKINKKTIDQKEELNNITQASASSISQEMSALKSLQAVAEDNDQLMKIRLEAVKKLQNEYPAYLGSLSKEAILAGDTADALERINQALINKSIMEAYNEKVGEQAKKYADLSEELRKYEAQEKEASNRFNQLNTASTNQYAINSRVRAAQDEENAKRKVKSIKSDIDATKKEMDRLQNEADKFGKMAAGLIAPPPTGGKPTGLTPNSAQLTGAKELAQAQAELRKQELTEVANQQKAIVDDVKRSINDRMVANDVYYAALIEMAKAENAAESKVEEEAIRESLRRVEDLEKRKAEIKSGKGGLSGAQKSQALKNIEDQLKDEELKQDAHYTRMLGIDAKYEADTEKLLIDAVKTRQQITNTGNAEWIKQQEDAFAKQKYDQLLSYEIQLQLLKDSFDKKLITRKQYDQQLKEIQHQQRILELEAQVEFDKRMLDSAQVTGDKRIELERKLAADKEALLNAQATKTGKPRQASGRITDSIATLFGGADYLKADLDTQQRYLQSFYESTVNLARNAADQILAINQRRIDAEISELDRKQEQIRSSYAFELEVINVTAATEADKQNMITQLRGQQEAQEQSYEQRRRQLAQQQARFQRTAAIASAISNTAVGVTKALAELGPLAAVVIPLIIASGAAQIAAISSAPIPQYAKGTEYHKGGAFIAGDGGQIEYIEEPGKKGYWSAATSTLYHGAAGTKVTPLDKYVKNVDATAGYRIGSVNKQQNDIMYDHLANLIGDKFDQTGENLAVVFARYGYKPQKQQDFAAVVRSLKNTQGW
jgi:hypothetical protein